MSEVELPNFWDRRIQRAWPGYGFDIHGKRLLGWQYCGSLAHGTSGTVIDDVDFFAVVNPPRSLWPFEHWVFQQEELDVLVYSAAKWLKLVFGLNPNMLATLATDWQYSDLPEGVCRELEAACHTTGAVKRFIGYANSHLVKLQRGVYEGYMGAERKALFDQFGYDPKDAAHTIRILRMGLEYSLTGKLNVRRPDAAELRVIKTGGWTLAEVQEESERLKGLLEGQLDAGKLPERPNPDHFDRILRELTREP